MKFKLRKAFSQTIVAALLTCLVYLFYSGEFIRESVEDFSFDVVNNYVLKSQHQRVDAPNLLLFKIDDLYLKDQGLLDKYGETTYGYIFPRSYLADLITRIDSIVSQMNPENYPSTMFIDYDISYSSDPYNKVLTQDDLRLLEVLKKERPYKIYFPKTSNYNMIERSEDKKIQELISKGDISFGSVGLTVSKDDISRRYYPFERHFNQFEEEKVYPLVDIAILNDIRENNHKVEEVFTHDRISLIENRIIFKGYKFYEEYEGSEFIQSYWDNLKIFSANYDLDSIIEEDFANAILFIGGDHSHNEDTFVMDNVDTELSGIEMHANALMTLFFFNGKLERLPFIFAIFIVCTVIFLNEILLQYLMPKINVLFKNDMPNIFVKLQEDGFIVLTIGMLFLISYFLLIKQHVWFNWLIPSLMASSILLLNGTYKYLKGFKLIKMIRLILWLTLIKYIRLKIRKLVGVKND